MSRMTLAALVCGPIALAGMAYEAFVRYESWVHIELSLSGSIRDFRYRIGRWPDNRLDLQQNTRKETSDDLANLSQLYALEISVKSSDLKQAIYVVKTKFGSKDLVIQAR